MIFGYHLNIALIYLILLHSKMKESWSYSSSTIEPASYLAPYFDMDVQRNITVTIGQTAFIHCRVERLGDKDVSFIRKRDLHILTTGTSTYTSDQRFQVLRSFDANNWTLQIKYPTFRDAGNYECQINTEPKISLSYSLNVVELKAVIQGPSDLYVKSGSEITLNCKLQQGPHDLGTIYWYKGSDIIQTVMIHENDVNSDDLNRISVDVDQTDGLKSSLRIQRAAQTDSGNYSCVPTIAKSASVFVNVISGEHPAAMQHNIASYISPISSIFIMFTLFSLTFVLHHQQHSLCNVKVFNLIR
ncbi:uncharacterized protein [Chironomus tepperi]|uniref:uncharacterized protein n=1 Tax=Chironomus tepperi TaxID=113505 RepID=UPI00391F9F11